MRKSLRKMERKRKKGNYSARGKEIGKVKKKKKKKGRETASELNENERDARDKRKPVTTDRMII